MATLSAPPPTITLKSYAPVASILGTLIAGLVAITSMSPQTEAQPLRLIAPVAALVLLTAVVWAAMVVVRNWAVLTERASVTYYADYKREVPEEWIERPARAFNNLLQVPILFYVVCLLMIVTRQLDHAQLLLAWAFVALRALHAVVYIGWNYVPYRFACFIAGCIALGMLWTRFLLQTAGLWS